MLVQVVTQRPRALHRGLFDLGLQERRAAGREGYEKRRALSASFFAYGPQAAPALDLPGVRAVRHFSRYALKSDALVRAGRAGCAASASSSSARREHRSHGSAHALQFVPKALTRSSEIAGRSMRSICSLAPLALGEQVRYSRCWQCCALPLNASAFRRFQKPAGLLENASPAGCR